MGLTLEIEHLLKKKGFDQLYEDHIQKWRDMEREARNYTNTCIPNDETIRPGDISENLQNAIKIDPHFEEYLEQQSLPQKYWVRYFSDYVLDQIYPPNVQNEDD